MLEVNDKIRIEDRYIQISFVRSAGPGGQNVNKLNTRAQLVFFVADCPDLGASVKQRLKRLAGRRMTADGRLLMQSDRHREQGRNRQECLGRLRRLILKALAPPVARIPTKPGRAAREKRLADKKRRGQVKRQRRGVNLEE